MLLLQLRSFKCWIGCSHLGLLEASAGLGSAPRWVQEPEQGRTGPMEVKSKGPNPNFPSAEAVLQQPRVPTPPNLTKVNNPLPQEGNCAMDDDSSLTTKWFWFQVKLNWSVPVENIHVYICAYSLCKIKHKSLLPRNSTVCTKSEFSVSLSIYSFFLQLLLTSFTNITHNSK